jgi:hypothetical protein
VPFHQVGLDRLVDEEFAYQSFQASFLSRNLSDINGPAIALDNDRIVDRASDLVLSACAS